jgi:hypothetical protein
MSTPIAGSKRWLPKAQKKGPKPASGPFVHRPSRLGRSTEIRHFEYRVAGIVLFVTHFLHSSPIEAGLASFLLL